MLLSLNFLIVGIQNAVIGIGSEIFYQNIQLIKVFLIISNIFLVAHASIGVYVAYDIFTPKHSKTVPFFLILLTGFILVLLTVISPISPTIDLHGQFNMNLPLPLSLFIFCMIFISGFSISSVFLRIYYVSKETITKYFSLVVAILIWLAVASAFLRVVVYGSQGVPTFVNILFSVIGLFLTGAFILPSLFGKIRPRNSV